MTAITTPSVAPKLLTVTYNANGTLTLHFDSNVSAGDGAIVISDGRSQTYVGSDGAMATRLVGASDTRTVDIDASASAADHAVFSGQDVTITLGSALNSGTTYSVTMGSGVVDGSGDGVYAGVSNTGKYSFSTASASAPTAAVSGAIHFTDTGVATDYITAAEDQVVTGSYTGTLGAHDFIQVSLDNGASWQQATTNADNHSWSYSGSIDADDLVTGSGGAASALLARVSNSAGLSTGTVSQSYQLVDSTTSVHITSAALSSDTGSSGTDHITKTAAQTLSGSYTGALGSGETIKVSVDGGDTWQAASASSGSWHAAGVTLQSGQDTIKVAVFDAGGHAANEYDTSYTLDQSVISLAGQALTLPAASDTGVSNADGVTSTAPTSLTLSVLGLRGFHAGDTIEILDTSHGSAVVGSYEITSGMLYYGDNYFIDGNFQQLSTISIDLSTTLGEGSHGLVAVVVDAAGNISATASQAQLVTVDHTAPLLSQSSPVDLATVSTSLSELQFTFSEAIAIASGTQVTVTNTSNPSDQQVVVINADSISGSTLTLHLSGTLTDGATYEVKGALIEDLAGNDYVTADTAFLHFTASAGGGSGGSGPSTPLLSVTDTAPESDAYDSARHSDHITNNGTVYVEGLSGDWSYSLDGGSTWQTGVGASLDLGGSDTTYAMDQIQVQQTVGGMSSAIAYVDYALTLDLTAPAAVIDPGAASAFNAHDDSISGGTTGGSDLPNEIVEITFDQGASWTQALNSINGWSLSGVSSQLSDNYGVRVVDQAGNVGANAVYFLASGVVIYSHADQSDVTLYGADSYKTIYLGSNVEVHGGDGNFISVGDNATVYVGGTSTVQTGNGNNNVTAGAASSVTTGSGNDTIYLSGFNLAYLDTGAGYDSVQMSAGGSLYASDMLGMNGVDALHFTSGYTNTLYINNVAVLHDAIENSQLTITSDSATTVMLNSAVWSTGSSVGAYNTYQGYDGSDLVILLIAQNVTVTLGLTA